MREEQNELRRWELKMMFRKGRQWVDNGQTMGRQWVDSSNGQIVPMSSWLGFGLIDMISGYEYLTSWLSSTISPRYEYPR